MNTIAVFETPKLAFEKTGINEDYFKSLPRGLTKGEHCVWTTVEKEIDGEEWKLFDDGINSFKVSNKGRCLDMRDRRTFGSVNGSGYMKYGKTNHDSKIIKYLVHRLVCLTFMPRPDANKLQVNHIDYNKENNFIENLEWVTGSENIQHSLLDQNRQKYPNASVEKYSFDGELLGTYRSAAEAAYDLENVGKSISKCCGGRRKTSGGFVWKYPNTLKVDVKKSMRKVCLSRDIPGAHENSEIERIMSNVPVYFINNPEFWETDEEKYPINYSRVVIQMNSDMKEIKKCS
jgi:hypothetical protein